MSMGLDGADSSGGYCKTEAEAEAERLMYYLQTRTIKGTLQKASNQRRRLEWTNQRQRKKGLK